VDFSESSQNEIAYAAKFAKATGSMLTLVNIQPTSTSFNNPDKKLFIDVVTERLEQLQKEVQQFFKISCIAEVILSGSLLSDAIAQHAADFSLVVMGTGGVKDLMEFFTGSKTYNAIHKSKIPFILVPSDCIYSEIKNIVYAFNYLNQRTLPLKQLLPWIKYLQCSLTVLQVNEDSVSQDVNEEMKELQSIISDKWKDESINIQFDTIKSSEIASGLNSYVLRNESDILALCTVHRNFIQEVFHKSVIKVISGISSYPVLVFHDDE